MSSYIVISYVYDKLMKWRLGVLKEHGLGLKEIQETIEKNDELYRDGAAAIFGPGTPIATAAIKILEILMGE